MVFSLLHETEPFLLRGSEHRDFAAYESDWRKNLDGKYIPKTGRNSGSSFSCHLCSSFRFKIAKPTVWPACFSKLLPATRYFLYRVVHLNINIHTSKYKSIVTTALNVSDYETRWPE